MKFSLISDMHIDFPQKKTPYDLLEQNVIIAGDTSNGLEGLRFLQKLRNKGFNVFAVDGNHEHYSNVSKGRSVYETTDRFRQDNPNVSAVEWTSPVNVIGCNGWYSVSDPDRWAFYQNDCRYGFGADADKSAAMVNGLCETDYLFLRSKLSEIQEVSEKVIVVTHTAPCYDTLDPRFEGAYSNEWYVNPLMTKLLEEFSDRIHVWCHGHTHASNEAIVHGVRVVCNPRGYPGENPDWAPLTIELDV